jgi:acyl carrier protein
MKQSEVIAIICEVAAEELNDGENLPAITEDTALDQAYNLSLLNKVEILGELEVRLGIPAPVDAEASYASLSAVNVPWKVSRLARYLIGNMEETVEMDT